MEISRLKYRHICAGHRNDPALFSKVVEEAINVFQRIKRGVSGYKFGYNDDHQLTIGNLKELNNYIEKIWNDEEIYVSEV